MKDNSSNLVFIVDDDPDDRQIILDSFLENKSQIDYVFIENAEALLENLYSEQSDYPSLILLDLNMPGMLGLQALKEIRSNKIFSHIPVVVLTTSTLAQDRKTSFELGANCFLKKPDSYNELVEITQAVLKLWLSDI